MDLQWDLQRNRDIGQFIVEKNVWHPQSLPIQYWYHLRLRTTPSVTVTTENAPEKPRGGSSAFLRTTVSRRNLAELESIWKPPWVSLWLSGCTFQASEVAGDISVVKKRHLGVRAGKPARETYEFWPRCMGLVVCRSLGRGPWNESRGNGRQQRDKRKAMWAQAVAKDPLRECTAVVVGETADDGREDASQLD